MVKRGSNFIPLVLDTRLLVAINGKASEKKQLNATYIMALLVEHCKNDLSKETYEELSSRYKKTIDEQHREKVEKEKLKIAEQKRIIELKERELEIRDQNREIRSEKHTEKQHTKETQINELKDELEKWETKRDEAEAKGNLIGVQKFEDNINEVKRKLKELGE